MATTNWKLGIRNPKRYSWHDRKWADYWQKFCSNRRNLILVRKEARLPKPENSEVDLEFAQIAQSILGKDY